MTLRQMLRSLFRSRGYAVAAIVTIAMGLASTTAVVAVTRAVLLRPLPYPKPEHLYRVNAHRKDDVAGKTPFVLSPIELARLKQQARTLEQVEGFSPLEMALSTGGDPETLKVGAVSAGFLGLFGLQPQLGRDFTTEEDTQRLPVAILDGGTWMRRFGSNPSVVGQTITLDGASYVVIGISPGGYRPLLQTVDVWIPLGARDDASRQFQRNILGAARLAANRTPAEARAEIAAINQQIAKDYPQSHGTFTLAFTDLRDALYGSYRPALMVLLAAVVSLLLIACANVANLTLCRTLDRRGEFALRVSLGASRASIVREQFVETAFVCLFGGTAGVLLAWWLLPVILSIYPAAIPVDAQITFDARVILLMAFVLTASAVFAGLAPALRAGRTEAQSVLAESSLRQVGGRRETRTRQLLVAAQVALSLVLLGLAAVVASSMQRLNRTYPGFDTTGVLTLQLAPPARYPDAQARATFLDRVLARISELPDVAAAGSTQTTFQLNNTMTARAEIEKQRTEPDELLQVNIRHITPGYVDALRVRVLEGRAIDSRDRMGTPMAAMVSESFAKRYWPGRSALGQRVRRVGSAGNGPWLTVVGVVHDVMDNGLGADLGPMLYVPYFQQNTPTARITLTIRTKSDPSAIANPVRKAIWSVDPLQPIDRVQTLDGAIGASVADHRFRTLLIAIFGALGLVLACVGVYSVAAYSAQRRTREIGVRMALGADRRQVIAFLVRRSLPPILIGSVAGLVATGWFTRLIGSILYKPSLGDAGFVILAIVVLLLCAVGASVLPARRAARLSPVEAIRTD